MKIKAIGVALLASLTLAACGGQSATEEPTPTAVVSETPNIKELVNDYSVRNITDHTASITSHQLLVIDREGTEAVYDLSEEDFFVSIAPYETQTHP